MQPSGAYPKVEELALQVSRLPSVEAVILGGSASTGMLDQCSDYDLYLYTREAIEPALREAILGPRAARLELQRDYWEWEDTWIAHDGTKFEIMYRGCGNAEQEVERRLSRYEASVGYTTCVLHTLAHGHILVDQDGWFKALQQRVLCTRYPDELQRAVIAKNFPVLGSIISSYEDQIESAFDRRDFVSLIHRTAAWLASYFDVVFAVNRQYHPGEKRLLAQAAGLPTHPANMVDDLTRVCSTACDFENCVADHLKVTRERLARWLETQGVSS
jgi:Domain of unknown function (DUF4037)